MVDFFNKEDIQDTYDVVILGAGPAGCSAGLYAARNALSVLILETKFPGGNVAITEKIENYPGFDEEITGPDLAEKFYKHATNYGVQVRYGACENIELDGDMKVLTIDEGKQIRAKSVILATGSRPKHLGAENESKFIGRGISFCATCDANFYKGKEVVVVGGGDSALEEAHFLTRFASKVTVVHRRNEFRAAKIVQKRAFECENIAIETPFVVEEYLGEEKLAGVRVKNMTTGEEKVINCDGVFLFVGWDANTEFLNGLVKLNDSGFIEAGESTETSVAGIFAAGDVRGKQLLQVITAASDGAVSAVMADRYIGEHFND